MEAARGPKSLRRKSGECDFQRYLGMARVPFDAKKRRLPLDPHLIFAVLWRMKIASGEPIRASPSTSTPEAT